MAAGDEVNIRFGASIDDVKSKLGEMLSLFKGVGDGAQKEIAERAAGAFGVFGKDAEKLATRLVSKWDELPAAFKGVATAVVAAGAVIGAGLFAKKMADENAILIESTRDLARALGTSTNEASVMRAVFDDVGVSQGEFEGAAKGLSRQLKTNEEGLNRLGLVTRDAAGNLRPLNELTLDGIRVLGGYKEGADRAMAGQELFGRGISASSRLMLINADAVEQNRAKVEELGLMVGEDAVAGWADYDAAADEAGLTMQAFAKAIQESVLPVATELTEWFNNLAPAAITVLRGAIAGLSTAFLGLTNGVRVVWEVINAMVVSVAEPIRAVAVAIGQAITGNFVGAAETIKGVGSTITGAWGQAFDKIADSSQKTKDRIGRMWAFTEGPDKAAGDSGAAVGTKGYTPGAKDTGGKGGNSAGKVASAENALTKAENEADLALQKEYLKQAQSIYDDAYKNNLLTVQEFYDAKLAIELRGLEATLSAKRKELEDAEKASGGPGLKEEQRLKFQAQAAKLQGEINVLVAQEANAVRANTAARVEAEQKLSDELASIRAGRAKATSDDEILSEKKTLDQMKALRLIDDEAAFAQERALEQRSYAAAVQAMAAKRALLKGGDSKGQAQADAEELAAAQQHQQRLTDIERNAELQRSKYSLDAQKSIQGNFQTMIGSLLNGTTKIGDAFRTFAASVATTFTNLIAQKFTDKLFNATGVNTAIDKMVNFVTEGVGKMVSQWVLGQTTQTAATAAGASTREGIEAAASAKSIATMAWTAIKNIGAAAWQAAASVYASIASIPIVGPFLAPAAAIAAGAVVLGFAGRVMSSEGGEYQVDQDRLNFVHKNETILPAPFAAGLRNLVGTGGANPLTDSLQQIQSQLSPQRGQSQGGLPTNVGMSTPEMPKPAAQPSEQMSDVGRMVMRWNGDDGQNRPLGESPEAMGKFQGLTAGQGVGARLPTALPSNPLARLQGGSFGGTAADGQGAAARRSAAAAPVQLVGASAGEFFIANRKQLLQVLNVAARDSRR